MGARSEVEVVDQPWPVVYDAFLRCLPTAGFRVRGTDPERGRIDLDARNVRLTLAVGAVDAITSEWVATAERRVALRPGRDERHFGAIRDSLERYLDAYYR